MDKKICFIMPNTYPLFNPTISKIFGGAELELYQLSKKFAEDKNYKVTFYVGDYDQNNCEIYERVRVKKIKYWNYEKYDNVFFKIIRYLALFKILLTEKSDIYMTKTASELIGWMVIFLKKIRRKKVMFRLGSDKDSNLKYWEQMGKRFGFLYQYGLRNTDIVFCQSKDQEQELGGNGINSIFIKNSFVIKGNQNNSIEKKYILWVSRCVALKRPQLFVDLAKRLPDEKFIMIMPSGNTTKYNVQDNIYETRENIVKHSKRLDNLKIIDYVPFKDIYKYYNNAKVFVNTSIYEGFPNSFIQSCIYKTPILSFNVNPDNFIKEYDLGCYCDNDINKAVKFIRELKQDDINRYGVNGYDYVLNNHNIDKLIQEYKSIIEKIL